jgi:hypothetical protein
MSSAPCPDGGVVHAAPLPPPLPAGSKIAEGGVIEQIGRRPIDLFSLDKQRGRYTPSFGCQYIVGAACGGGIHYLDADA